MKKRILSAVLSIVLLVGTVQPVYGIEAAQEDTTQMALVDAILPGGSRDWVYATLVLDDRSTNPMAILQNHTQSSMAEQALDRYYGTKNTSLSEDINIWCYQKLVDTMFFFENPDTYIAELMAQGDALFNAGLFGMSQDLEDAANDLVTSAYTLSYESILKAAYTLEVTASNGDRITDTENSLITLRQTKDALKYLKNFLSFARTELNGSLSKEQELVFETEYIQKYVLPYISAAEKYLNSIAKEKSSDLQTAEALTAMAYLSTVSPALMLDTFSYQDYMMDNVLNSTAKTLIGTPIKLFDKAGSALDTYLCINSLQDQKSALGSIRRAADLIRYSRGDIAASLDNFCDLMDGEYDEMTTSLTAADTIIEQLRADNTMLDLMTSVTGKAVKKFLQKTASSNEISACSLMQAQHLSSIINISLWVADQSVGLKDTCKKTYELIRWNELMEYFETQCEKDILAYWEDKTEENAGIVLDDLLLLQRMRLYGEKIAHGITSEQLYSWLGKLYAGETSKAAWDTMYQRSVDTLMAATVAPTLKCLEIDSFDTAEIVFNTGNDGDFTAVLNGSEYYVELRSRLAAGIYLDHSAEVIIENNSKDPLPIGYIEADGFGYFTVEKGEVLVGELYQEKGGVPLNITIDSDASLNVSGRAHLMRYSLVSDNDDALTVHDLDFSDTTRYSAGSITVTGNIIGQSKTGTAFGGFPSLFLAGEEQTITGKLQAEELHLRGDSAAINGEVIVYDTLSSGRNTGVTGGENICFRGTVIENGYFNGSLTAYDATLADVTFGGTLYDSGLNTYEGEVCADQLYCIGASRSEVTEGSSLTVRELLDATNGDLCGKGSLKLCGDLQSLQTDLTVYLEGSAAQHLADSSVHQLIARGSGSVTTKNLSVTGYLEDQTGQFARDAWVDMEAKSVLGGSSYSGSLTFSDLTVDGAIAVRGDVAEHPKSYSAIYLRGGALTIAGALNIGCGLNLDGCAVTAPVAVANGIVVQNNGALTAQSITTTANLLANSGGTICSKGDISVSSLISASSGGSILAEGNLSANSFSGDADGSIRVRGDLAANTFYFAYSPGDVPVYAEGDVTVNTRYYSSTVRLFLCGTTPQTLKSPATVSEFALSGLVLANSSAQGVTVDATRVVVSDLYATLDCPLTQTIANNIAIDMIYAVPDGKMMPRRVQLKDGVMEIRLDSRITADVVPMTVFYRDGRILEIIPSTAMSLIGNNTGSYTVAIPENTDACAFILTAPQSYTPLGFKTDLPLQFPQK
ncbi:MAG: hypothetical protein IJ452_03305 [Butyricicoccus sp.]|nr:hypothetical protein [Butyricicoccus sp.]